MLFVLVHPRKADTRYDTVALVSGPHCAHGLGQSPTALSDEASLVKYVPHLHSIYLLVIVPRRARCTRMCSIVLGTIFCRINGLRVLCGLVSCGDYNHHHVIIIMW